MASDASKESVFLYELYSATNGDPAVQASATDIGAKLGLEADEAGEIAQNLCIQGLAELLTLSGGIGITLQGLKTLNVSPGPGADVGLYVLGPGPVLGMEDVEVVEKMLARVKKSLSGSGHPKIEEMVIDIKTIEVQMLSPQPKTDVIKALFRSLAGGLKTSGPDDLLEKLNVLISS